MTDSIRDVLDSVHDFFSSLYLLTPQYLMQFWESVVKEIEEADLQLKILYVLLGWLGISFLLILVSWAYLGKNVVKMLTPNGALWSVPFCCQLE
ncbi:hypothetical protein BaRGS_00018207 [Batillaria attramentaria]|uniref:Uncharacterized protein n=1 Tax=Batillaria attramentaria TaxID=370345 RepID=A0ABD0KTT8_9CAEN